MLVYRHMLKNSSTWKGWAKTLPVICFSFFQTGFPVRYTQNEEKGTIVWIRRKTVKDDPWWGLNRQELWVWTELQGSFPNISLASKVLQAVHGTDDVCMQLSDTQEFPHRHFHNICATWTCPVLNVIHNRAGETEKSTVKLGTCVQIAMSNYNLM